MNEAATEIKSEEDNNEVLRYYLRNADPKGLCPRMHRSDACLRCPINITCPTGEWRECTYIAPYL